MEEQQVSSRCSGVAVEHRRHHLLPLWELTFGLPVCSPSLLLRHVGPAGDPRDRGRRLCAASPPDTSCRPILHAFMNSPFGSTSAMASTGWPHFQWPPPHIIVKCVIVSCNSSRPACSPFALPSFACTLQDPSCLLYAATSSPEKAQARVAVEEFRLHGEGEFITLGETRFCSSATSLTSLCAAC